MEDEKLLKKINLVLPCLNEGQKRIYLASEAEFLGRGGKKKIEKLTGVSHNTINKGISELGAKDHLIGKSAFEESRGREKKKVTGLVWEKIKQFIEPHTRGESQSALQWVSKSLRNIESALKGSGANISHRVIGEALKTHGFPRTGEEGLWSVMR